MTDGLKRYAVVYRYEGQPQDRRWVSMPVANKVRAIDALLVTMQRPIEIRYVSEYSDPESGSPHGD